MNKYEKNFLKMINEAQVNCCKSCSLEQVLSDDFYAYSYECLKCEHRYKTLYETNPEYDLETLFKLENYDLVIKYSEELKDENKRIKK